MIIPVQKNRVFETVYEQMVNLIESGVWKEGDRIPGEIELANEFNVSRNSLRTAIKVLHTSEILESKPGLGTFVANDAIKKINNNRLLEMIQDESRFDEILEVRHILEKETAYAAAVKRSDEDVANLEKCLENLKDAVKKKDVDNIVYWGSEFHSIIIKCAGNSLISGIYESLRPNMNAEKQKTIAHNSIDEIYSYYIKCDEEILSAIKNKDGELAEKLMKEHLLSRNKYK